MKCQLKLLLLAAVFTAPAVSREPLVKTAKPDTRTVVISPHGDAEIGDVEPNTEKQTVEVTADAKLMMRGENRAPVEDDCSDLIGSSYCESLRDSCDDPFKSTFMKHSCRKTCGICQLPIPTVECEWGSWQEWSRCDQTCGKGSQFRLRSIRQHASGGGDECQGPHEESASCNEEECPTTTTIAMPVSTQAPPMAQSPAQKKKQKLMIWIGVGSVVGVVICGVAYFGGFLPFAAAKEEETGKRPRSDTTLTTWTVHDDDDYGEDYDHDQGMHGW
jgi:hypothetical protein